MAGIVEAAERGDFSGARAIHRILGLMQVNFCESARPVKFSIATMGMCEERFRLPMVPPRQASKDKAAACVSRPPIAAKATVQKGPTDDPEDDRAVVRRRRTDSVNARGRGASAGAPRRRRRVGRTRRGTGWRVNTWVKQGILLGIRFGDLIDMSSGGFFYFDKDTMPLKPLGLGTGVRIVPGGSAIRDGAHLAKGVICIPPMYVNVGAYVGEGSMVDSHALVGSCADRRPRHLSAAAQIGGVIEPSARCRHRRDDVSLAATRASTRRSREAARGHRRRHV
jgi:hypothetical protein